MCTHDIYLFFFIRIPLDRRPQQRKAKYSRPEKAIGGALHNIGIQHRDRRTTWSTCKEIRAILWVRDRLPISAREWKQKINKPHVFFVSDLDKNLIWDDILQYFTL